MKQIKNNKIKSFDGIKRSFLQKETSSDSSWFKNSLRISSLKMIGATLTAWVLLAGLGTVGGTVSYYVDRESSAESRLIANQLSFDVQIASSTSIQVDMDGDKLVVPFMFPLDESGPIQYSVSSEFVSGDSGMCNAIKALGAFPFPYDGNLVGIQTATSTQTGSWALTLSLPNASLFSNTTCVVNLVYKGWNASVPAGEGYSDIQTVSITFNVGDTAPPLRQSLVSEPEYVDAPLIVVPQPEPVQSTDNVVKEETVVPPAPTPIAPVVKEEPKNTTPPVENVVTPAPTAPTPIVEPTPEVVTGPTTEDPTLPPIETTETPVQ